MDPLSHWALGVGAATSLSKKKSAQDSELRTRFIYGGLGAVFPDIDAFIQSTNDPLLYVQFHRHFTHSLAFTPLGALVVAGLIYFPLQRITRIKTTFFKAWLFCLTGMLTHGFLDACTSYGTHLFWPFSQHRSAWNIISIIDPLFTVPLLIFLALAWWKKKVIFSRIGLSLALLYLGVGMVQRERSFAFYQSMYSDRAHLIERMDVKPSFANLWLWRGLVQFESHYYVDALYVPFIGSKKLYPGDRVEVLDYEKLERVFPLQSQARVDLKRFEFFSNSYLYLHRLDGEKFLIGDLRYSLVPNSSEPLWVIILDPEHPNGATPYETVREVTPERKELFFKMLKGEEVY